MEHLHPLESHLERPQRFTYPFCYEPHPLCQLAAKEVQAYIAAHPEIREDADQGKMFGVLVVDKLTVDKLTADKLTAEPSATVRLGFLAAYSGLLAGRNDWGYFVPPVYDAQQPDGHFKTTEREISRLSGRESRDGRFGRESRFSRDGRSGRELSQELQTWLFHQYRLLNARGEVKDLVDIWQEYYNRPKLLQKYPLPPGGTGDCCAPKLLQYAYQQGLKPLCMAEFWWGATTKTELRQHLNYYPACRGKCKPILTWMLQGLDVDPDPELQDLQQMDLPVVYEDEWLVVVNKPSGLLSVPGRIGQYSVETIMQERNPDSKVVHRLDMGTSGLLIVAKTQDVYRALQEQFVKHQIRKKYLAVLSPNNPTIPTSPTALPPSGSISLPLRPDPMNRPRQVVDPEHGKRAVTDYEFLSDRVVALWPQTGRTHQLRIHCAHPDGLGRPIVGDELYGTRKHGQRLLLHAAELWFRHPVTLQEMHLEADDEIINGEITK
ncbi:MAG: RluA family pseudouridine synthase [Prevotella sp.]|nr:RluA family pseudouridine synthase [Prevotella sp.]